AVRRRGGVIGSEDGNWNRSGRNIQRDVSGDKEEVAMKQGTQVFLAMGLGLALLQSGCAKKVTPVSGTAALAEERAVGEVPPSGLKEEKIKPGAAEENVEERRASAEPAAPGGLDDIFFEFDQASLREESKSILQKDAKFI